MQVYTGLDIGTAKVTKAEQAGIAHHLIDCRQLEENYSVADFQKKVDKQLRQLFLKESSLLLLEEQGYTCKLYCMILS